MLSYLIDADKFIEKRLPNDDRYFQCCKENFIDRLLTGWSPKTITKAIDRLHARGLITKLVKNIDRKNSTWISLNVDEILKLKNSYTPNLPERDGSNMPEWVGCNNTKWDACNSTEWVCNQEQSKEQSKEQFTSPSNLNNSVNSSGCYVNGEDMNNSNSGGAAKRKPKHKYGTYQNVLLTDDQLEKLKEEFPYDWEAWIDKVSGYCQSTGKTYKDYLATIRNWSKKDKVKKTTGSNDPAITLLANVERRR